MITVLDINPEIQINAITAEAFDAEYLQIAGIEDIPVDKPIIIFHPRKFDMNPKWLTPEKVENFNDFDFPEDAYYVIAADHNSDIAKDINDKAHYLQDKIRWVRIPTKKWEKEGFKSINGCIALGIILWERYKKLGLNKE